VTVAVKVTDWPYTEGLTPETTVVVVPALFTFWVRGEEVLVVKLASPRYTAVMVWLPAEREEVAKVAMPALRVPEPMGVPPSRNWTVPVGVPAPGATAVTAAVKVTNSPSTDGLISEATVVVVLAWFTVWVRGEEVLVVKLVSPRYTAVMVWPVTEREEMAKVAVPALRVPEPIGVPPSRNSTEPVGVPAPGATALTVAVKVTDWP
jgi:hypothetical protein